MSNLKDELNKIDVPDELHMAAKKGIQQAYVEKKRRHLLPHTMLALLITAAALLFVMNATVTTGWTPFKTASANTTNSVWLPFAWPYVIAFVITVLLVAVSYWLINKMYNKTLVVLVLITALIWNWNVAHYRATALAEPLIMPVYFETLYDSHDTLFVNYALNKEDKDLYIKALRIGEQTIFASGYEWQDIYTMQQFEQYARYIAKQAQFEITSAVWDEIDKEARLYAQMSDGSEQPIPLQFFDYARKADNTPLFYDEQLTWQSSSVDATGGTVDYTLANEQTIEAFEVMEEGLQVGYEIRANNEVIARMNYNGLPNMNVLPYAAKARTSIQIRYTHERMPNNVTTYQFMTKLYTNKTIALDTIVLHPIPTAQEIRYLQKEGVQNAK